MGWMNLLHWCANANQLWSDMPRLNLEKLAYLIVRASSLHLTIAIIDNYEGFCIVLSAVNCFVFIYAIHTIAFTLEFVRLC